MSGNTLALRQKHYPQQMIKKILEEGTAGEERLMKLLRIDS